MTYLIIVVFALQGQIGSLYMGETHSQSDCARYANENFPKVYPDVKEALILCTPKRTT
jgi:hypothetical protein